MVSEVIFSVLDTCQKYVSPTSGKDKLTFAVTAIRILIRMATAPPFPQRAIAPKGIAIPELTSSLVIRFGYVGKVGRCSVAAAVRPNVVAVTKGIVNQQRPPSIYPESVAEGSAAMAFWNLINVKSQFPEGLLRFTIENQRLQQSLLR